MVEAIDRSELLAMIETQDLQIVDVLPPAEYESDHIPGAVNIPLRTLDGETTRVLDHAKPVAVY